MISLMKFSKIMFKDIDFERYDIIAHSTGQSLSWFQLHASMVFGEYLSRKFNKKQIFGGFNITSIVPYKPVYDDVLKVFIEKFKYVICGAGEHVLLELVNSFNSNKSYEEIIKLNGMGYIDNNGEVLFNSAEKRRIICPDFDGLDFNYYSNYINKEDYKEAMESVYCNPFMFTPKLQEEPENKDKYEKKLIIPYVFNYNCPYSCTFCIESDPEAPAPIIGKIDKAIEHLSKLSKKYDTKYFYFINNAINCSKKYVNQLCDELIKNELNIYWSDCARFDNVDYETLIKMKKAGCRKLIFGMRTASKDLIKRIDKKLDLNYVQQVLEWCYKIGIWAELEIIIGLPSETKENFYESLEFMKKNTKYINFLTINRYIPVPRSIMFRFPERYNIEIVQKYTYEDVLAEDREIFKNKRNTSHKINMLKVFKFKEINGRNLETIHNDTDDWYTRMDNLRNERNQKKVTYYIQKGYLTMKDISYLLDRNSP